MPPLLRLSKFFGTSAKFWLGLQDDFDLEKQNNSNQPELDKIKQMEDHAAITLAWGQRVVPCRIKMLNFNYDHLGQKNDCYEKPSFSKPSPFDPSRVVGFVTML